MKSADTRVELMKRCKQTRGQSWRSDVSRHGGQSWRSDVSRHGGRADEVMLADTGVELMK